MKITDTVIVHRVKPFNIHKKENPKVEELYVPILRKHYVGIDEHPVILDENEKEFICCEITNRGPGGISL